MASKGKKTTGRRTQTRKEDEPEQTTEQTADQTTETQTTSATENPVVTDWSKDSKKIDEEEFEDDSGTGDGDKTTQKSVVDFDRTEVATLATELMAKHTFDDMLKVLIYWGEQQKNPAISAGCKKILKQINSEPSVHPRRTGPSTGQGQGFSQGPRRDGFRSGGGGRDGGGYRRGPQVRRFPNDADEHTAVVDEQDATHVPPATQHVDGEDSGRQGGGGYRGRGGFRDGFRSGGREERSGGGREERSGGGREERSGGGREERSGGDREERGFRGFRNGGGGYRGGDRDNRGGDRDNRSGGGDRDTRNAGRGTDGEDGQRRGGYRGDRYNGGRDRRGGGGQEQGGARGEEAQAPATSNV